MDISENTICCDVDKSFGVKLMNYGELIDFVASHDYSGESSEETIQKHVINVYKFRDYVSSQISKIYNAINTFTENGLPISEVCNDKLNELENTSAVVNNYVDLIKKIVGIKQKRCNHNWHEKCHDSHHIVYICDKCGKEDRV